MPQDFKCIIKTLFYSSFHIKLFLVGGNILGGEHHDMYEYNLNTEEP